METAYSPSVVAAAEKLRHHAEAQRNAAGPNHVREPLGVEAAAHELESAIGMLGATLDQFEAHITPLLTEPVPMPAGEVAGTRSPIRPSPIVSHLRDSTQRIERLTDQVRNLARRLSA